MKNQFVTYEIATELKNLGYDEPVIASFLYKGIQIIVICIQKCIKMHFYLFLY